MQPAPLLTLGESDVHIWYVWTDQVTDPATLARYHAVLSAAEQVRQQRFHFEKDRHQFLVSHAAVRFLLSRYAHVPPVAWEFSAGRHGKPEIASPTGLPIQFNLSHTHGLAAVAVTLSREIGVDVEYIDRRSGGIELADRYFAPAEVQQLRDAAAEKQREMFFDFWTLKEAYIKARGMGLALPLDGFAYDLRSDPPRISFTEAIPDDPASWQFARCDLGQAHKLAVALQQPISAPLALEIRETVP